MTAIDGSHVEVAGLPPTTTDIDKTVIDKLGKLAKTPQGISSVISSTSRGPRTPKIPTYITTDANQSNIASNELVGAASATSSKTSRMLISSE